MTEERVLALDISTKTGWALLISNDSGCHLEMCGQIEKITEPIGQYPINFLEWANLCYIEVAKLVDQYAPDHLVIEETSSGSKSIYSQKILEYIHYCVAQMIKNTSIPVTYFMTEQWRREVGCSMTKEESKRNKQVKKYKVDNGTSIAYNEQGKRIGKITRKHINIRRANEVFEKFLKTPLRKKDEDTADSLLLGFAYHLRRIKT